MNKRLLIALLAVVLATINSSQAQEEDYPDYESPIRTAADDEVKNLPGLDDAINFRQYSGYLEADKNGKKFNHYWFVESQNDPAKDPVLLWLNGGPGCSSMEGLFAELGPFQVNDDGKTLKLRETSWNKMANVLFLESPTGVGFSYDKKLLNVHTDDTTAKENHLSLKSFFKKFPQYKNNALYLSGESYAGVYLPTLGVLADADPELNLKGIAIGNGYLDVGKLSESLVFFAYYHGLIGSTTWKKISRSCCDDKPPSPGSCVLSGKNSSWGCGLVVAEVTAMLDFSGINPYNLYGDCVGASRGKTHIVQSEGHSAKRHLSRETVDRALFRMAMDPRTHKDSKPFHVLNVSEQEQDEGTLGINPPCTDEHLIANYLNTASVRNAIHIPKNVGTWDICATLIYIVKYPKLPGGLKPQMQKLISSKRNLTMLVYNGDVDTVCNFLGDEWFVDGLGRKVLRDYSTWKVDKQVAGYLKHYDGITYATVRGSGHMVPQDRPREAFEMMKIFLNTTGHIFDL